MRGLRICVFWEGGLWGLRLWMVSMMSLSDYGGIYCPLNGLPDFDFFSCIFVPFFNVFAILQSALLLSSFTLPISSLSFLHPPYPYPPLPPSYLSIHKSLQNPQIPNPKFPKSSPLTYPLQRNSHVRSRLFIWLVQSPSGIFGRESALTLGLMADGLRVEGGGWREERVVSWGMDWGEKGNRDRIGGDGECSA